MAVGSELRIIGVDCATKSRRAALAVGTYSSGALAIEWVKAGTGKGTLAEASAAEILTLMDGPSVVLALDAPLGWPAPLAKALTDHKAGERLGDLGDADRYVSRTTDAVVHKHLGVWPLDVGADLIARTAFAALELIAAIRRLGRELPMLWMPGEVRSAGVIEVYPKATLLGRGLTLKDYKSNQAARFEPARRRLVDALCREVTISAEDQQAALASDDALDAIACVVAGKDFLDGNVVAPEAGERVLAEREGWIWFRKPNAREATVPP